MIQGTISATLTVRLLGRLEVAANGTPVRLTGRHAQALVALLALRPRPRLRDAIAAELWPDIDGSCASSLRQALWLVRSGLVGAGVDADAILETDQDTIGLRRDARLDLDVARFEQLVGRGGDAVEEALEVYQADLLEGLGHECFAAERERLADVYEDALADVARTRLARGDVAAARSAATALIERDDLREEAHAVLIAAYGLVGSRSQVVRQYRRLSAILRTELAVAPLPETEATYRAALAHTVRRSQDATRRGVFERRALAGVLVSTV